MPWSGVHLGQHGVAAKTRSVRLFFDRHDRLFRWNSQGRVAEVVQVAAKWLRPNKFEWCDVYRSLMDHVCHSSMRTSYRSGVKLQCHGRTPT